MQLPCPGKSRDASESMKHAASLPKPPFPNPASLSIFSMSLISMPKSFNPSFTVS